MALSVIYRLDYYKNMYISIKPTTLHIKKIELLIVSFLFKYFAISSIDNVYLIRMYY